MPNVEFGLANQANRFMAQQAQIPYQFGLPGYSGLLQQRSKNVGGLLRGEVPPDVLQQIQQAGAERGVATGSPGSPNANAAWLRALGLTSLGLQQEGSKQLSQSLADVPVPELWNPMALYVPERTASTELQVARKGAGDTSNDWGSQFDWMTPWRWTGPSGF